MLFVGESFRFGGRSCGAAAGGQGGKERAERGEEGGSGVAWLGTLGDTQARFHDSVVTRREKKKQLHAL